jgi:transposase
MTGSYIAGIGRNQSLLMPETVDDYISEDNPVKLFDSFVNSLDLAKLGFCLKEGPGRPSYDP